MKKLIILISLLISSVSFLYSQTETLTTTPSKEGVSVAIEFVKGKSHNHPLMAIWMENMDSSYLETLYVAKSIATSVFGHGDNSEGVWKPGIIRRPAALPYWAHKRGVKAEDGLYLPTPDNPVPDAISGPTPPGDFVLNTVIPKKAGKNFRVLFEINQSWDWNEYWTNSKFPEDNDYKTSSQPSIIYEAVIDLDDPKQKYIMQAIGHGHYSGKDGKLYEDLSTMSTAKQIVKNIVVEVEK